MEIPLAYKRAVSRYDSIKTEGLTLYPIKVSEYEEYLTARPAIEIIIQSLPVRLISLPLLEAVFRIDYEKMSAGEPMTGLFYRTLLFLALSLRLGEGKKSEERVKMFRPVVDPSDPIRLKALYFEIDGEEKKITPIMYHRLRPILAAQNGIELANENANPDLIEAERDIAELNGPKLCVSIESLVSSVAALSNIDEAAIYDWPILKLQNRQKALKRALDYIICGIGETQGTKWKGGNPYPHPFYEKERAESASLVSLDTFAGGKGLQAIENAGGI